MESGDREGHCAANCESKCTSSYYTEGDIDEKFDEILRMINRAAIFCTPTSPLKQPLDQLSNRDEAMMSR